MALWVNFFSGKFVVSVIYFGFELIEEFSSRVDADLEFKSLVFRLKF